MACLNMAWGKQNVGAAWRGPGAALAITLALGLLAQAESRVTHSINPESTKTGAAVRGPVAAPVTTLAGSLCGPSYHLGFL